jgi:Zn-dependent protease with chaperone function
MQILLFPALMFPLFEWINPERSQFYFSMDRAVFKVGHWLDVWIWGIAPVWLLLVLLLLATTLVTLWQEIIPVVRNFRSSNANLPSYVPVDPDVCEIVQRMSEHYGIPTPALRAIQDEDLLLFVSGTRNPSIIMSTELLTRLDSRQMEAALAHEMAHIVQRSTLTTLVAFLARAFQFFNPVSLFTFRNLIQDDELVCDEMTVAVTGDPEALGSALGHFRLDLKRQSFSTSDLFEFIAGSSHNSKLQERMRRLKDKTAGSYQVDRLLPIITAVSTIGFCYFVV